MKRNPFLVNTLFDVALTGTTSIQTSRLLWLLASTFNEIGTDELKELHSIWIKELGEEPGSLYIGTFEKYTIMTRIDVVQVKQLIERV